MDQAIGPSWKALWVIFIIVSWIHLKRKHCEIKLYNMLFFFLQYDCLLWCLGIDFYLHTIYCHTNNKQGVTFFTCSFNNFLLLNSTVFRCFTFKSIVRKFLTVVTFDILLVIHWYWVVLPTTSCWISSLLEIVVIIIKSPTSFLSSISIMTSSLSSITTRAISLLASVIVMIFFVSWII